MREQSVEAMLRSADVRAQHSCYAEQADCSVNVFSCSADQRPRSADDAPIFIVAYESSNFALSTDFKAEAVHEGDNSFMVA